MRIFFRGLCVFVFLFLFGLAVYWDGLLAVPMADHSSYMAERYFTGGAWDWFWHSVSYSRTRFTLKGDQFLFRPLMMAVLAVEDILFRSRLYVLGILGIAMQAAAGSALYLFAQTRISRVSALLVAALFVAFYAGLEMVAWRHITPYLGAPFFAMLGILALEKGRAFWAGILLFCAMLFHEFVFAASLGAAAVFFAARFARRDRGTRKAFLAFAIPALLYLALNVADYMLHQGTMAQDLETAAFNREGPALAETAWTFLGGAGLGVFAPMALRFEFTTDLTQLTHWIPSDTHGALLALGAVCALALWLFAAGFSLRDFLKDTDKPLPLAAVFLCASFAVLVLGLALARGASHGPWYIRTVATYYFSLAGFVLLSLLALAAPRVRGWAWFAAREKIFKGLALAGLGVLIGTNAYLIHKALEQTRPSHEAFYKALRETQDLFARHPDYRPMSLPCFYLLLDTRFRERKNGRPVYPMKGPDGSLWVWEKVPWQGPVLGPQDVFFDKRLAFGGGAWAVKENSPSSQKAIVILSRDKDGYGDFSATARGLPEWGLLLHYRDPANTLFYGINGREVALSRRLEGVKGFLFKAMILPFACDPCKLEVRHAGGFLYLFANDYLVQAMPWKQDQGGRTGVLLHPGARPGAEIQEIRGSKGGGFESFASVFSMVRDS